MDMCIVICCYIDLYMNIALAHMALCLSWRIWTGRTAGRHSAGEKGVYFIIFIYYYYYFFFHIRRPPSSSAHH